MGRVAVCMSVIPGHVVVLMIPTSQPPNCVAIAVGATRVAQDQFAQRICAVMTNHGGKSAMTAVLARPRNHFARQLVAQRISALMATHGGKSAMTAAVARRRQIVRQLFAHRMCAGMAAHGG